MSNNNVPPGYPGTESQSNYLRTVSRRPERATSVAVLGVSLTSSRDPVLGSRMRLQIPKYGDNANPEATQNRLRAYGTPDIQNSPTLCKTRLCVPISSEIIYQIPRATVTSGVTWTWIPMSAHAIHAAAPAPRSLELSHTLFSIHIFASHVTRAND